jgi:hypothetical protein
MNIKAKKPSETVVRRHWTISIEESSNHEIVTLKARGKTAIDGKDYASFFCPTGWDKERVMKEIKSILWGFGAADVS